MHRNDEFRKLFKVGDLVQGYTHNKVVRITAIGKQRFLFEDPNEDMSEYKSMEKVSFIENATAHWRKPEPEILKKLGLLGH